MKKFLLRSSFFLIPYLCLIALLVLLLFSIQRQMTGPLIASTQGENLVSSPIEHYYSSSEPGKVLVAVGKSDSRPVIVDNFLARHRSPMSGMGEVFVSTADRYGLDYRLLPAIAFQESTLGRHIPRNSHNAWGWAIYTGAQSGAKFNDWAHAIDTVGKGLKYDYIDRGLHTPEAIMTRYAESPDGSWAFGVQFAMEQMNPK